MSRSMFYLVTDSFLISEKTKNLAEEMNVDLKIYTVEEWNKQLNNPFNISQLQLKEKNENEGTVLPFPGNYRKLNKEQNIMSMNEIEAQAIENAISKYKGNLTEAAKVLGIGRATLYRKIKQYNIDPSQARRNKYIAA